MSANKTNIPLSIPDLRGDEAAYLMRCVNENWVSSAGPFVAEMEQRMAALCNRSHGVAASSGTSAIQLALMAAGVKKGDAVIVPDWSFAATANAVIHTGAIPVFVDITEESWTLDPALVADVLDSPPDGRRIAAVLPVHSLGHPADMDSLAAVCAAKQIPLLEDAAPAIGARYCGRPVGGLSAAAAFSFNGNKTVTTGGGGMVVTDNEEWAVRIRHMSTQARVGIEYNYDAIGHNFRMTNLSAALGLAQLERLNEMVGARRNIATRYDSAFRDYNCMTLMPRCSWAESSCWLYSIQMQSAAAARDLQTHLNQSNIDARPFWTSLSAQKPYESAPKRLTGITASLSGTVISLPSSSQLTTAEQDRVIAAVDSWCAANYD